MTLLRHMTEPNHAQPLEPYVIVHMRNDLQRISAALELPPQWLVRLILLSVTTLFAAAVTREVPVALVAAGCGLVISGVGARAAIRPSRPFRLESPHQVPSITTTRRLGLFYMATGFVWTALSLMAALGS